MIILTIPALPIDEAASKELDEYMQRLHDRELVRILIPAPVDI